jgi:hypothetical protein
MKTNKELYKKSKGIVTLQTFSVKVNNIPEFPKVITFDGSDKCLEKILKSIDLVTAIYKDYFTIKTEKGILSVIPGDRLIIFSRNKVTIIQHEK